MTFLQATIGVMPRDTIRRDLSTSQAKAKKALSGLPVFIDAEDAMNAVMALLTLAPITLLTCAVFSAAFTH